MPDIVYLFRSSKKFRLLAAAVILLLLILLVFFLLRNSLIPHQPSGDGDNDNNIPSTSTDINFEGENTTPEYYRETLPDGGTVEYGTRNGPLTPERLDELKKAVDEEKNKSE